MTKPCRWKLALLAALLLAASSPPAWLPGAELLVLAGLGAWYAVATSSRLPYLLGYAVGILHIGWFAWSLIPVTGGVYVAIVALGAVYYLLVVGWTRGGGRFVPAPIAFGCGVAATSWLRAHMPEIPYPHGQFAHALYQWPWLLGPVRWGGEVLMNGLLALVAAGSVDLYRAWRVGTPRWGRARALVGATAASWIVLAWVAPPAGGGDATSATVDVAAFEPGRHEAFRFGRAELPALIDERLIRPTVALAGRGVADPPDLVIWPESAVDPYWLQRGLPFRLDRGVILLGGSMFQDRGGDFSACVAFGSTGRAIGWHEKQVPVPAAERMPFTGWAPDFLLELGEKLVGYWPTMSAGRWREPLETTSGIAFGGLVCFDNAFDDVARRYVADGARLLAVVSNEIWYDGGAELDQMVAMTVFRALETGTPVIRSTVDGLTVAVGADGGIRRPPPESAPGPRVLRANVEVGPGALGPLAWCHPAARWLALLSGLALIGLIRRK